MVKSVALAVATPKANGEYWPMFCTNLGPVVEICKLMIDLGIIEEGKVPYEYTPKARWRNLEKAAMKQ